MATAFTDVELLLQDDTWQTLSTHTPDENGVISLVTSDQFINYTLVAKDQKGSDAEGLNVVSFYQASSDTPSHYQAQFDSLVDNTTCECVTQNIELSHRPFASQTSVTSSLAYNSWQMADEEITLFEGVNVCRAIDGSWPLHSFSVSGFDSNDKAIAVAGFIDDFTSNEDNTWQVSAFDVADSVDLPSHQEFSTNQIIGNTTHFSELVAEDVASLLVFDTHSYISEAVYQSQASVTFTESNSIFGSTVIKTHHQVISEIAQESFAVKASEKKPTIDEQAFSEIKANGNYNYTEVSGYPMAIITFEFTAYDPGTQLLMPAQWTFYGPKSGTLAISGGLTGYEDIIDIETDKKSTDVYLIKSSVTNNYQDYISYYQAGNSVSQTLDTSDEFIRNIHRVEIGIKLN
ncbi:hypothetical protein [Colwellia sp. E2M01]|uniref:hypothetical protein n=1 Tax=Colwellia sp. E2M01 TaxID=2841561 RepID=UPI0020906D7C|nr:hypothetical protein [Colwellia sp. E2M01]